MDKRLIEILQKLQEEYGQEKGLKIFEQINDQVMITIEQTVEQANKDIRNEIAMSNEKSNSLVEKSDAKFDSLRSEMKSMTEKSDAKFEQIKSEISNQKWTISIIVGIIAVLISIVQYFAGKGH